MADNREGLDRLIKSMRRINAAKGDELRKLMEFPNLYNVAEALAAELINSLSYLFNFESATDHEGNRVDILNLVDELEKGITREFEKITGRPYIPEICRRLEHRRKGNQT